MDERTAEILKRFTQSWTVTDAYFADLIENHPGFEILMPFRKLIALLKQKGYDNFFRLGTSMHALVISRSVVHGLRADQKYIRIEACGHNRFEVKLRDGDKIYREYMVDDLEDARVIKLLKTLKATLID